MPRMRFSLFGPPQSGLDLASRSSASDKTQQNQAVEAAAKLLKVRDFFLLEKGSRREGRFSNLAFYFIRQVVVFLLFSRRSVCHSPPRLDSLFFLCGTNSPFPLSPIVHTVSQSLCLPSFSKKRRKTGFSLRLVHVGRFFPGLESPWRLLHSSQPAN